MRFVNFIAILILFGSGQTRAEPEVSAAKIQPRKITEQGRIPPAQPGEIPEPFGDRFVLRKHDVVAFLGGTHVVEQGKNGYLETLLTRGVEQAPVHFRNLGWEADTVYSQPRPRNFGSLLEELNRIHATVVVANFGQMEALMEDRSVQDFQEAYRELLQQVNQRTRRVVLVSPYRFENTGSSLVPDLTRYNGRIAALSRAIEELAQEQQFLVVDLSGFDSSGNSRDGIHLNDSGHWDIAFETVSRLTGASPISGDAVGSDGTFNAPRLESLRQTIMKKNFLWQQNWRPTNWAFAYGNRQHVPSSHDHRPGRPRWFPVELDGIIKLIEAQENEIVRIEKSLP